MTRLRTLDPLPPPAIAIVRPHITSVSSTIFQPFASTAGGTGPPPKPPWVVDLTDADAGTLIRPAGIGAAASYPAVDPDAGTLIVR